MKRKHRVVIEITANKPITQKRARDMIDELIDLGRQKASDRPAWWRYEVTKIVSKEFERVIRFYLRERGLRLTDV